MSIEIQERTQQQKNSGDVQPSRDFIQAETSHNFYQQIQSKFINDEIQYELQNQRSTINSINYGSMITLIRNSDNTPKYMLGPHYFMFIPTLLLSTWFLIYSIQTYHQKLHFGTLPLIICTIAALFFIISFLVVGISNPGIASTNKLPTLQSRLDSRYCRDCKVLRVNKTRHCQFCNVCILQMDHHCIWVGKCIGKNNMNKFKIFIFSALTCLTVFAICIFFSAQSKPLQIK